jgi:hypothetical protein
MRITRISYIYVDFILIFYIFVGRKKKEKGKRKKEEGRRKREEVKMREKVKSKR